MTGPLFDPAWFESSEGAPHEKSAETRALEAGAAATYAMAEAYCSAGFTPEHATYLVGQVLAAVVTASLKGSES